MIDYFHLNMDAEQLLNLSSLGLAHLGDGVYELMVRSWLCLHGKATSKGLHRATVHFVAAPAQAAMAEKILPILKRRMCSVVAGIPTPTPFPGPPAGRSTRPPRRWRRCSDICISRGRRSASMPSSP